MAKKKKTVDLNDKDLHDYLDKVFQKAKTILSPNELRILKESGIDEMDAFIDSLTDMGIDKETLLQAFAEEDAARRQGAARISYKIGSRTNMRTLPEEESKTIITLPAGAEVLILGKSGINKDLCVNSLLFSRRSVKSTPLSHFLRVQFSQVMRSSKETPFIIQLPFLSEPSL